MGKETDGEDLMAISDQCVECINSKLTTSEADHAIVVHILDNILERTRMSCFGLLVDVVRKVNRCRSPRLSDGSHTVWFL